MKTLAIVNQKGGVWKTTTAVTVAHGLALCNLDVLLVDLDAQGNVADCLGLKKGPGLHDFLLRGAGLQAITESGRPHLDVIMGDPIADVMIPLLCIAEVAGFDALEAVRRKALGDVSRGKRQGGAEWVIGCGSWRMRGWWRAW